MAKPNYQHARRKKEQSRKLRQQVKQQRRMRPRDAGAETSANADAATPSASGPARQD